MYCFFFKQKTAYEMRISDWSSDVCSSDLYLGDPLNAIEEIGAAEFQAFRHVSDVPRQQSFSAEEVAALLKPLMMEIGADLYGPDLTNAWQALALATGDRKSTRLNSSH